MSENDDTPVDGNLEELVETAVNRHLGPLVVKEIAQRADTRFKQLKWFIALIGILGLGTLGILANYLIEKAVESRLEPATGNTSSDISRALGMTWWNVRLPRDLKRTDYVGLAYKLPDGSSVEGSGSSTGWKAGTVVKVAVWDTADQKTLRYAIFRGGRTVRGRLEKKPSGSLEVWREAMPTAGDVLMKFGDQAVSNSPEVGAGEVGLVLHVSRRKY